MNRQKAVDVLEEILKSCNLINQKYVSIHPSKEEEYEIHIKNQIAQTSSNKFNRIIQKHSLDVKDHKGFLVIYTRKTNEK